MKPKSEIHYVSPSYKLKVTLILESKSDHPDDRRKMTDAQIAINLHKYCPHIMVIYGSSPVTKGDYTKKRVTAMASVIHVTSTGRAIDIVTKEIEDKLDSVYIVRRSVVGVL